MRWQGVTGSSAPIWSVVIPTYDRHDTLAACLERLAPGAQTLEGARYEVIVSDDARRAATRRFLAERFPWVRYTPGPACGPAANRNHGASVAKGLWLVFTDDDTLPSRGWLAAYAAALEANARVEALEGRTTCSAGFGTPMHYAPVNERGGLFWSCNVAVRADRFREVGGFDEGFTVAHMEDQDLREMLRLRGVGIDWVPNAVVDHPPRRQPAGRRLGLQRAAEVRYLYKHGAPRPVRWRLMRGVASLRVGIVRSLPWSGDSLLALRSLASELWTVWCHGESWERAAEAEFPVPITEGEGDDLVRALVDPRQAFPRKPLDRANGADGPSVTVIVPTWKRPDELTRCLRALAAQTRPPDEVIVVTRMDDDESRAAARAVDLPTGCERLLPRVHRAGVVGALQEGLDHARGAIIALTDDDAEPRPDWIARLVATFATDREIGGVGGRDWQPGERGDADVVGKVQWFGRVVGRHPLGAGPARDVDVLKGVNCAFRGPLARAVGMDAFLHGDGAQVHWELALCLPMRSAGWRLVYDPAIAVEHHVAPRESGDQVHRGRFAPGPFGDAVHNEARALSRHLASWRWAAFTVWAECLGTTAAPGLLAALRLRAQGHVWAWEAWAAARRARAAVRGDRHRSPPSPRWIPMPGTLP